jgi:hypothetical protein
MRSELALAKDDVATHGEGASLLCVRHLGSATAGVDPHLVEGFTEARLHPVTGL